MPRSDVRSQFILTFAFALYAVSTLVSMAAMSVATGLLILTLVLADGPARFRESLIREWRTRGSRTFLLLSFVLALSLLVGLLVAKWFPLEYGGASVRVHLARDMAKAWYLFWPFLLAAGLRRLSERGRARVLESWLVAFAFLSLLGLVQYFTGWPRPQAIPGLDGRFHVTLFLGHHLSVGSIFLFPFFALLELTRSRSRSALLPAACAVAFLALVGTYSRILWVALPVGLLVWGIWSLPRKVAIAFALAILLGAGVALQTTAVRNRVNASLGVGTRVELWSANWEFFKERPLTGAGWHHNLEAAGYYFHAKLGPGDHFVGHAHNNFLEMLGGTGLLGTISWLFWCGLAIWLAWSVRHSSAFVLWGIPVNVGRAVVCAWLVFHLSGMTQVNFWESKVLHQIAWVIAWCLAVRTWKNQEP